MPAPRRYAAFLRGVMPTNCAMPALRDAFEAAGFTDVATVLGTGNVVFTATGAPAALAARAEAAMTARLGRSFPTIVRPLDELAALLAADPFADLDVPADAKRVVTFVLSLLALANKSLGRSVPAWPMRARARYCGRVTSWSASESERAAMPPAARRCT